MDWSLVTSDHQLNDQINMDWSVANASQEDWRKAKANRLAGCYDAMTACEHGRKVSL